MNIEQIKTDPKFIKYIQSRGNLSDSSKQVYTERILHYCNYLDLTPTDLIQQGRDDQTKITWLEERRIDDNMTNYYNYLKNDKKLATETIQGYFTTVKAFYKKYGIIFPEIKIHSKRETAQRRNKRLPTKKEIRQVLSIANVKYKAIILLMLSSAVGAGELNNLTYKDFINAISYYYKPTRKDLFDIHLIIQDLKEIDEPLILQWDISRKKTGVPYTTFSSPESTNMLFEYFISRTKKNRGFKSLDDPLFENVGNKMAKNSLQRGFWKLNYDAGFGKHGHHAVFKSHNMRKLSQTWMRKAGVSPDYIKYMSGQINDNLQERYQDVTPEMLFNDYIKSLNELSISEDIKTITIKPDELLQLEEKYEEEISELRDEVELLARLVAHSRDHPLQIKDSAGIPALDRVFEERRKQQEEIEKNSKK